MLQSFKQFALRGNAVDLAIGVIIGAAFGGIVTSLVNDILMPPIGVLLGKTDFSNLFLSLGGEHYGSLKLAKEAGAATLNYGLFVNTVINFAIVAMVLFAVVQAMNRLRREQPVPAPAPSEKECPHCTLAVSLRAKRCPHCTSEL